MIFKLPGFGSFRCHIGKCADLFNYFKLLAVLSLLVAGGVADAQSYLFRTVKVEGNQRIETATILSYAGITPGKPVEAAQVNDAGQRLRETGLFEDVVVEPRGATLVIKVSELPTINRIAFEGNRRLKDDALAAIVKSKPRRVLSLEQVEADAQEIARAYAQQGRIAARVTPKVIRRDDNRVDLVFEVFEGAVIEVKRISFIGNRVYSDRRLRRVLGTKQAGLLRAIIRADTYVEDRIEFDKQVLRDFYMSRGFVDFKILSVTAELTEEHDGYLLTFHVREGQQFRFGKITVSSDLPEVDVERFRKVVNIRPGRVYSPVEVDRVIARLERLGFREGIDFLRVEPRVKRNDRELTLDVEFVLSRGPKVFVERIDITGNVATLDRVIRRQFRIVEGDPFNPREIRESAARIRALGYFKDVQIEAREGSSPQKVIVTVDVEEQPTGSLTFGASYTTGSGFGINAQFKETNFLGRGQTVVFGLNTTENARTFTFNFNEPAFLGRQVAAGFNGSFSETNQAGFTYNTTNANFSPYVAFPVGEFSRLQTRYVLDYTDITSVSSGAGTVITSEAALGARYTSGVGYTFTYDTRNRGLNPNAGFLLQFGQDFAGLGGSVSYVKTSTRAAAETRVWNEEITLRAKFQGGAIHFLRGQSRVTDRFLFGTAVMRGFEYGGIGPRELDGTLGVNDAIGGHYYAVGSLEAEFPLPLPDEYGISAGVFYDAGSLWGTNGLPAGAPATTSIVSEDFRLRQVVGFSIFWTTPLGPLRFNFSRALQKESYDVERRFEFTVQTQF